jgi:hypothetical protein
VVFVLVLDEQEEETKEWHVKAIIYVNFLTRVNVNDSACILEDGQRWQFIDR